MIPLHNPMLYVNSIAAKDTCSLQNVKGAGYVRGGYNYVATRGVAEGEELVVDYGADYFLVPDMVRHNVRYECGVTALSIASGRGDVTEVERLLQVSPQAINQATPSTKSAGWAALAKAAFYGHLDVTTALLAAGADTVTKGEYTAALVAADNGLVETLTCNRK